MQATLWAAAENMERHGGAGGSRRVFLTLLGGGVFGNPIDWIADAIEKACCKFSSSGLEVFIVSYARNVPRQVGRLLQRFAAEQSEDA